MFNTGLLAILGGTLWVVILFALPETLRARVGNGRMYSDKWWIMFPPAFCSTLAPESERGPPPPKPTLKGYWRLFCYPPIGIACLNTAMVYSSYFCIAIQLPAALEGVYGWTSSEVGAAYVVVGVAMVFGSTAGGRFSDWNRKGRISDVGHADVYPETRLDDQVWGLLVASAGLIMFGFFVEHKLNPSAPLIATFLGKNLLSVPRKVTYLIYTICSRNWNVMDVRGLQCLSDLVRGPASCWCLCPGQHAA